MKTANTLFGESSGKIGGAVASKWKGYNVVRSKPLSVANPRTAGQVLQRNKMKYIVALLRPVQNLLKFTFREMAVNMSEFNAAQRANFPALYDAGEGSVDFHFEDLIISKGTIAAPLGINADSATGTSIHVTWTDNTDGVTGMENDQLNAVAYSNIGGVPKILISLNGFNRNSGTGTFNFDENVNGSNWGFCFFYLRAGGGKSSDSVNIGFQ